MPNINFELNLNKHPKDVPNRALVSANNVQLSGDLSCLQSEFCIKENYALHKVLVDKYIAGYISCNKEFILFIANSNWKDQLDNNPNGIGIKIYRFREQGELDDNHKGSFDLSEGKLVYEDFIWNGGKLKGAFTYNIKSQLIISVAESNSYTGKDIPLKTINLGKYEDDSSSIDTDLGLSDKEFSLNPELKIPSIKDYNYVNGLAYKGWYYFFIRYKINSVDYTKWFSLGYPILINEIEKYSLFDYNINKEKDINSNVGYERRGYHNIKTEISSGSNTCNTTVELNISNLSINFKSYQIGFICTTNDSSRAFKSLDLNINSDINNFYLDYSSLEEYNVNDLTFEHYNYYNVKNIINYKNRLYISNYKENDFNYEDLQNYAKTIKLNCIKNTSDNFGTTFDAPETSVYTPSFERINIWNTAGFPEFTLEEIQQGKTLNDIEDYWRFNGANFSLIDTWYNYLYCKLNGKEIRFTEGVIGNEETGDNNQYVLVKFVIGDSSFKVKITCLSHREYGKWNTNFPTDASGDLTTVKMEVFDYEQITFIDYIFRFDSRNIINTFKNRLKDRTLIPGGYYKFYIHFVNKYGEFSDGIPITREISETTNVGDDGFSNISNYTQQVLSNNELFVIPEDIVTNIATSHYYTSYSLNKYYLNYEIEENFIHDNNIIGFFLSYEKYNDVNDFQGILTNYDFYKENETISGSEGTFTNHTDKENIPIYRFYSDEIDLKDTLEIKSSKILLFHSYFKNGSNIYDEGEHKRLINNIVENKQTADINDITDRISIFDINSIKYVPAHSFTKDNDYRGSYLEVTLVNDSRLSDNFIKELLKKGCVCKLISNDSSLYNSLNKELIKFTNVIYFDNEEINNNLSAGLNGFVTFNKALVYNNDKVILNTGFNVIVNSDYAAYIGSSKFTEADDKIKTDANKFQFVMQYSFPMIKEIMYETRQFKNLPEIIITRAEALSETEAQATFDFATSTIVQPLNSIDLYTLPIASQDKNNPKIYINHMIDYVNQFDKRVVRSNPIADESFENSWRIISPEAYKDITENKGNITNLIALGTTLLVHTEHSIFMFDRDNTLQGGDGKAMQLAMPDIFDVDYKEVLASELGSCGLQDSDAWVLDEFGYIFYDNDAHKFYRFGSKKIESINTSITQFIDKHKPFRVRFANDAESNRILVNIQYIHNINSIGEVTLSYNYVVNKWISFHDYCFDRAFHTKQMLYMIVDRNNNTFSQMYLINRQGNNIQNKEFIKNGIYNQFDNIRDESSKDEYYYSSLDIMINDAYELIKTLEYITWKLYKIIYKYDYDTEYNDWPREDIRRPYSGYQLQVYNDNINTGPINISIDNDSDKNKSVMNYKKPWWQYDNWNFNYLRDKFNAKERLAPFMSRLYGNYFIVRILFGGDKQRCEFETLDCKLINNKTI